MSFEKNDVLSNLFANAIRSPQPSTSSVAPLPAARPTLAHSKSIGAEPSTPRRPMAAGKRVPRRSTASFSTSCTPVSSHHHQTPRKGGSVSPPQSQSLHLHGSASPFAGAKFSESPSARQIPLPPTVWFEDDESPCPPSDTESISSFTTTSSISSSSSDSLPLGLDSGMDSASRRGFRVSPLQLIAAVSAL
ncbi:hypothetical protein PENTCL1PPCAC_21841 [Pristionchus entomophagus]|uniref:Uncharacterized protein n=1 Tax=Pristionchus entomophagus TaxID=358040 RepID=A0AAV5TZP7_9BILA|nr:hypothetical protein PENTCL1PPCAC_21841 [Pristionchus entomophagus]